MMDRMQLADQMRRALQMFVEGLTDEQAMAVATVYPKWAPDTEYATNELLAYGANDVGDPQLYRVVQAHTSQAHWTPNLTASLYKAIGLDDNGHPVWSQPTGAHDAYNKGDIVNYHGVLYRSLIDGNIWAPDAYPQGWEAIA